jgi:hypothetical protein
MSDKNEEENLKKLVALKSYLEKRVHGLEEEINELKNFLDVINDVVATKSFRRAEVAPAIKYKQTIPLKTKAGVKLANMYVGENTARIAPVEDFSFNIDTPPLQSYLVNRVLISMKSQDMEAVKRGKIDPDKAFSYDIICDGDTVKEILIKNYGDTKRLREIKSLTRWTLEKMYEKSGQEAK